MRALSKKKFYPVIHCLAPSLDPNRKDGVAHALENARIADENGADGIFLIGHGLQFGQVTHIYDNVRRGFPGLWIGVNFLDIGEKRDWVGLEAVAMGCKYLNALWVDQMPSYRLSLSRFVEIFGGVAFKYIDANPSDENLIAACKQAKERVDVATTSGDATGIPPSLQKLATIRATLKGEMPVAVASGVSETNVTALLPYVDIFLVASSISEKQVSGRKLEYLVPEKVRAFADTVHRNED